MNQSPLPLSCPEEQAPDPFEGTSYRLVRVLARGGMGQVYLVEHRELGRECVAKLVHEKLANEPQLLERVRIEAESLGSLNHPNIVSVNNFGLTLDGRPFIVMEYLLGRDLGRELASGRVFSLRESLQLVIDAASALSAVHDIGIVHRDIKPENLFLHEEPDGSITLKVLDFGVARVIPGASPDTPTPLPQPTAAGVIVGTLRYASPEGISGQRVDYRADIYSLALVLYRLLTGRSAYGDHLSDAGIITATLTEAPATPSSVATQYIPSTLDNVVLKALQKSPEERYATMKDFRDALWSARDPLDADENVSEEVVLPLNRELAQDMSLRTSTVVAVRSAVEWRKATLDAILFATVLLVTTVLVGIFVVNLRHSMGAP
jgi:eukaryotic-like serine/threonine-protein kinase